MAFQEAEKLLAKGARVVFEPGSKDFAELPATADVDLAAITGSRLVSVYQYKPCSIGNLESNLSHSADQLRDVGSAARRVVVIRLHDVTRTDLQTWPSTRTTAR